MSNQEQSKQGNGLPTRALVYMRTGSQGHVKVGSGSALSIATQREACHRKAAELGASVEREFIDLGASARDSNRTQLRSLMHYIRTNPGIAYVLVQRPDRLSRSVAESASIRQALSEAGATLESATESVSETPSSKFLHTVMAAMAEFYSRNLAMESAKGKARKAQVGGTPGRASGGHANVRHVMGEETNAA